ncbi:MAG: drug/metabolite exporter YedA [Candidatus Dormibacteraceae bacterium]
MSPSRRPSAALVAAALGTIYLVWGTTYIGIRVADETIPPFFMTGVRYTIAGAVLFGIVAAAGGIRSGLPTARHWLSALLVGIGLVTFGNGGVTWGEQYVPSGVAAIVVATMPLWMAVLARAFLGERLRLPAVIGLALGFVGLVILVAPAGGRVGDLAGLLAVLVAAIGWAAGSVYSKSAPLPANPFQAAGMQMFCGGLVALVVSVVTGDARRFDLARVSPHSRVAFVYLLLVGAVFAFGIFQWLVRNAPLSLVGTYAYVNPIVAVVLGSVLLGEHITGRALFAGGVIVAGVALIVGAQAVAAGAEARSSRPSSDSAIVAARRV